MGSKDEVIDTSDASRASLYHPLGPLTGAEFETCAAILQASWPQRTSLRFKSILLLDPRKCDLLPYLEAQALPRDSETNLHGTGYTVKQTKISKSDGYDLDITKSRVFKIANPAVRNGVNASHIGYKIQVPLMQFLLADQDSYYHKRAEFADHNVYITKHRDDELFAGGVFTNQSRGGTGVRSWADRNEDLDGQPVVWVNFGMNHFSRLEDFPVMPMESLRVSLRPDGFFDRNPAVDVLPAEQKFNQSTLLTDRECCGERMGMARR